MKTAISIPDDVFRSAESLAKRLGVSRSQLYANAVSEFVSRHKSEQVTARLNAVYDEAQASPDLGLMRVQEKSLEPEEW